MKRKNIIIYTFQSLEDPLIKGLILEYLLRLKNKNIDAIFHLITHEQTKYKLSRSKKVNKIEFLKKQNIFWYPINYKTGKLILLKKIINFIESLIICLKIKIRFNPQAILGFLSIAGGYSYIISKIFKIKLIIFCFEPHSRYMLDFKTWELHSLNYKLLNYFEIKQLKAANFITLPTKAAIQYAKDLKIKGEIHYLPISVDTELFNYSESSRIKIRNNIGAKEKTVLIYTGKFGGIYYSAQVIILFFKKLLHINNNYFLYIITPDFEETLDSIKMCGINEDNYYLSNIVDYNELNQHLSAADIGLIAIPPLPSQLFRTPVKTGLYLSCGLPYIVNKGIGDNDYMAKEEKVGIVVEDIENINAEEINNKIISLLSENKITLRERCRKIALKYQDNNLSVNILEKIIENI